MKCVSILITLFLLAASPLSGKDELAPVQKLVLADKGGFCTAFSINQKEGLWVTAGHCGGAATIAGHPAEVVKVDTDREFALLKSKAQARSLPLAQSAPRICYFRCSNRHQVTVIGFPFAVGPVTTHGFLSARGILRTWVPNSDSKVLFDAIDALSRPGNSGSPVLNWKGDVIGIVVGGWNGGITYITPWEVLQNDLRLAWEMLP